MGKSEDLKALFQKNRQWADNTKKRDPQFFEKLAQLQAPKFMWIGCADSRVPATEITGLLPGEMFVHRNVANIVVHTDLNCLSVLQFAVEILKVDHVIVCGHYGCGGITAVCDAAQFGLIDNWLMHVKDVENKHAVELKKIKKKDERFSRLCELNVMEQATHVCETTVVQDAWKKGQQLSVHAVIYDIHDGLLKKLWSKVGPK